MRRQQLMQRRMNALRTGLRELKQQVQAALKIQCRARAIHARRRLLRIMRQHKLKLRCLNSDEATKMASKLQACGGPRAPSSAGGMPASRGTSRCMLLQNALTEPSSCECWTCTPTSSASLVPRTPRPPLPRPLAQARIRAHEAATQLLVNEYEQRKSWYMYSRAAASLHALSAHVKVRMREVRAQEASLREAVSSAQLKATSFEQLLRRRLWAVEGELQVRAPLLR